MRPVLSDEGGSAGHKISPLLRGRVGGRSLDGRDLDGARPVDEVEAHESPCVGHRGEPHLLGLVAVVEVREGVDTVLVRRVELLEQLVAVRARVDDALVGGREL